MHCLSVAVNFSRYNARFPGLSSDRPPGPPGPVGLPFDGSIVQWESPIVNSFFGNFPSFYVLHKLRGLFLCNFCNLSFPGLFGPSARMINQSCLARFRPSACIPARPFPPACRQGPVNARQGATGNHARPAFTSAIRAIIHDLPV